MWFGQFLGVKPVKGAMLAHSKSVATNWGCVCVVVGPKSPHLWDVRTGQSLRRRDKAHV